MMLSITAIIAADFDENPTVPIGNSINVSVSEDVSNMSLKTQRVTVQKVAQPRELTSYEKQEIAKFLAAHKKEIKENINYRCLTAAIPFLIGMNICHVPIKSTCHQFYGIYQSYTEGLKNTDFHVNIPIPEQLLLPVFVPRGTTNQLIAPDLVTSNSTCAVAPKQVGAKRFGQNGQNEEVPIGFAGYRKDSECKTSPEETCDPGGEPAPPPPPADVP